MNITNARYSDALQQSIIALVDGVEMTIPVSPGNRHYAEIVGKGITPAPWEPPAPTEADVIAERQRRLALGFDFDFGDARGVHRIGTTPADMAGWQEVTDYARALTASGDTTIAIVTDTGPVQVTAAEWDAILLAAARFRQPIWGASFQIAAMSPIPADYTADAYWPA